MIIIEGCDATGKTTLAKELAEKLNFDYFKDGFHRLGVKYYLNTAKAKDQNTICDRFHLGEYVYPIIKKDGRIPLTKAQQFLIEKELLINKSVLIYCETSKDFIANKFDTRGEDFVVKNDINQIISLFRERVEISLLPKFYFDVQKNTIDQVIDFLSSNNLKRI
jgi:thymidylate kinase